MISLSTANGDDTNGIGVMASSNDKRPVIPEGGRSGIGRDRRQRLPGHLVIEQQRHLHVVITAHGQWVARQL
jgi:hypothetical protein